jgi:bidirectional [NiFe] hydrogenase diaphorase subunit
LIMIRPATIHTGESHPVNNDRTDTLYHGVETILSNLKRDPDALIEILHASQQVYGWLDRPLLALLAAELKLPFSLVYGVASFYHAFRLQPRGALHCTVCTGTSCHIAGGSRIMKTLEEYFNVRHGSSSANTGLSLERVGCLGACEMAPLIRVESNGTIEKHHAHLTPDRAVTLIQSALEGKPAPGEPVAPVSVFGPESARIVLSNHGKIDPESLESARSRGGYEALAHAVCRMKPEDVCRQITASGLRGRGGGGWPAGRKWDLVRLASGKRKFVVANGDEGDPGAFMDRTLMETDPHRILEGMAIAGYAVGAKTGFVYVRGEYPLAARRLRTAIRQAHESGILGRSIFGTGFAFDIHVRIGAGAFVCGEETSLMASIMGRRGQPVIRPPYPSQRGLWGTPTLINNVETFGCIAPILRNGPEWFRSIGTPGSSGTKVFSISGDIARAGVVEVPMGTTLREIIEMAGGVTGGDFKAAQTGGAGGGCIPAHALDMPMDFDSLKGLGAMLGSGGLVVINDTRCMVDVARFFMGFCAEESCGKCTPCRTGTQQAVRIIDSICSGSGTEEDLHQLEELCLLMQRTSLCGLGMSAPGPVLSTLRWFRSEYLAHIREMQCPVDVCRHGGSP